MTRSDTSTALGHHVHDYRVNPDQQVLLEHLAASGWFARNGEVALTSGLTFCLTKDPGAARGFVSLIRRHTGLTEQELPHPDRWEAESIQEDRGRVDVTGWRHGPGEPGPILLVEAKIAADLGAGQTSGYAASQRARLERAGIAAGALVVLVPEGRVELLGNEVTKDLEIDADEPCLWRMAGAPSIVVTILSWNDALEAMLDTADSAVADLEQLLGACRALKGADVPALTTDDLEGGWRNRPDDLRRIVDRVTRAATAELSLPLAPWQPHPAEGLEHGYRYLGVAARPNLAVGIREGDMRKPFWVRWHRETKPIHQAERRLVAAGHPPEVVEGHCWLALDVEPDDGPAVRQIQGLASQVVHLYRIAADEPSPV